jgi:hypothetical protein
MAKHTNQPSAREELRRLFERALMAEPGIGADTASRAVRRLMRRTRRIVELSDGLKTKTGASRKLSPPPKTQQQLPASLAPPSVEATEFDPFAFSAVVVLARFGRGALMDRLIAIEKLEHLRKLAAAQHLCVGSAIEDPAELRAAIVEAAERRMVDRHAAAS